MTIWLSATPTTDIYSLSLHDALPICAPRGIFSTKSASRGRRHDRATPVVEWTTDPSSPPMTRSWGTAPSWKWKTARSEEHTSELQSHSDLVCRLLLEKKKRHAKVQDD